MTSLFSVGGLSSGLDTESIVSQLVEIERLPITRAQTRQAELQAVDTAWSGLVTGLSAVRTALDELDTVNDYDVHTAVSGSDDAAITVTRTGTPAPGGFSFTVSQLAQSYQGMLSGSGLTSGDDAVGSGTIGIRHADDAGFTSIATDGLTLDGLVTAINKHQDVDVNASVQQASDGTVRLVLNSRRSGEDGALEFDLSGAPATLDTATQLFAGQDALLTMGDGSGGTLEVTSASNTLTDLVKGVSIELRQTTAAPVSVSVTRDPEITVEKVQSLVDAANEVIGQVRTATDYDPETDTAGVLQGDPTASDLRFSLVSALTGGVPDAADPYSSAAAIGITVNRDGTLKLNTDTLTGALADDPDAVITALTAPAAPAAGEPGPGVFTQLDAVLDDYEGVNGRISTTRQGLSDRIAVYDDQIERYEVRVELRERLLRQKFTTLESTLGTLQAQGANLLAQLGISSGGA